MREFLGWSAPLLHSVADRLLGAADEWGAWGGVGGRGVLDLSRLLVVLSGARAGRRLKELLVDRAEEAGCGLCPPQIITAGQLPERLYAVRRAPPPPALVHLAWREALEGLERASLLELLEWPEDPGATAPRAAAALAGTVERLYREVSAAGCGFREVAGRSRELAHSDGRRWLLLAQAEVRYHARLASHDLEDLSRSRRSALAAGRITLGKRELWVACVPDLAPIVRAFLTRLASGGWAGALRILVGAPAELAYGFDALGCVVPGAWEEVRAGIPDESIRVASRPGAQADAVIRRLSELPGPPSAEEITIGVPDEGVIPYLAGRLFGHGIHTRYSGGRPLAGTGTFRLLADLASYIEEPTVDAFGSLLRYPVIAEELARRMGARAAPWAATVDRYQTLHLQARIGREDALPAGGEWGARPLQPSVEGLRDALWDLLADWTGRRTLGQWVPHMAELIRTLLVRHSSAVGLSSAEEGELEAFAGEAGRVLGEFEVLPAGLDAPVGGGEALSFLLDRLSGQTVPPTEGKDAIELLGWLELALDDAPHMIVCGVNEPHLPESAPLDPFLPPSLRRALGLPDDRGRFARDLLYLRTIRETRAGVTLIAGRWDARGNPLRPSRLLFAEDEATVIERVRRCFGERTPEAESPDPKGSAPGGGAGDGDGFPLPPQRLISAAGLPARIPVTAFRSYLSDPYRYALESVLRLERVDDQARELDPLGFGTLAHTVLGRFAGHDVATSSSCAEIEAALDEILDLEVAARFGSRRLPALSRQIRHLRDRLRAFARWQAGWVAKGWRIRRAEVAPRGDGASLLLDGRSVMLAGTLDRVDHNEQTDEWCVLDYKTGEVSREPEKMHRKGSPPEWTDLQLPLYRFLAGGLEGDGGGPLIPPEALRHLHVGYVVIPRDLRVRELFADWDDADFVDAERRAGELMREILDNRFEYDPERWTARADDPLAAVVGGRVLTVPGGPAAEEGG